ncbi:MAG: type II secretion system protein [Planctomycetota bacterium]|jgi:prepilin-type N-terminal cleavage/methylation domain-containing protein
MSEAKKTKRGFTLVELLTVLAIITLLVGLLVPSLTMVRRTAKEAKQKAMLASIEAALTAFRNDYGDYPPSDGWDTVIDDTSPYGGAQKLAEAMLGRDLMGFHPATGWRLDDGVYPNPEGTPPDVMDLNLRERRDRYLELATINAFYLGITSEHDGLYHIPGLPSPSPLFPGRNTFVLCDVFGRRKVTMGDGKVAKAGAPILYYKADTSSKLLTDGDDLDLRIYAAYDNVGVIVSEDIEDDGATGQQPLAAPGDNWQNFYDYIQDPTVPYWPYRPDSYLLITAGYDGIYGTADDITNFGN